MSYHASGRPVFRTGSVVVVPADVRASLRYGANVKASAYSRVDLNGMNAAIARDALRPTRGAGKRTRVLRDEPSAHAKALARAARERTIAGVVRSGE